MKRKRFIFFLILTFVWLGVIYSFSLEPSEASDDTSLGLIDWMVTNFFPWLKDEVAQLSQEKMSFLHHLVRKIAHFTEYFILGVLAACTMLQTEIKGKAVWKLEITQSAIQCICALAFCILAASVDETIQLFVEGRAGRVGDVLLDSTGAAVGILVVLSCVCWWRKSIKKKF